MFWPISEIFSSFALSREIISTRSSLICRGWPGAASKAGTALKAGVGNWPGISIGEGRGVDRWSGFFSLDSIWSQIVSEFLDEDTLEEDTLEEWFRSGSSF
jgi:hypothetical protein